jgi:hexulose-6-phosphate isomerase
MDATGIKVHGIVDSVHWSKTLTHPAAEVRAQGLEGLQTAIRDCRAYSGVSVLLVPGVVNKDVSYDDAWNRSTEQIKKALPLAEELKIKIAIENVWNNFLLSPLEAVRYVDQFNSPWVAWHFDIGNVIHYGWPEQWARILGPRVCKLHIKEFSRKKSESEGLWKGFEVDLLDGDNNWPEVVKALDEIGYPGGPNGGWATAEVRGGDEKRLKEISDKMDKIIAM